MSEDTETLTETDDIKSKLSLRQNEFISNYIVSSGNKTKAAEETGISRQTVYAWLEQEDFRDELELAERALLDDLRVTAHARALEKSDVLMIFLMKAIDPSKYDDNVRNRLYVENLAREIVDEVLIQAEVIPQSETVPEYDS